MNKMGNIKFIVASLSAAFVLTLAMILFLGVQGTQAATLDVCTTCTYTTIQSAIDAAVDGDLIRVESATYNENLVITKSLTLEGGWDATFTTRTPRTSIVDGGAADRVINVYGLGLQVTVDGFEITNGASGLNGGGIFVDVEDNSVVTINDNFIHDNAGNDGGGIYADVDNRSSLHITANDVMTNTTTDDYAGIYANIYLSGTLTLSDNEIAGNLSGDYGGGAYLYAEAFVQFQVEDNLVMSNTTATDLTNNDYGGLYFYAEDNSHGTFDRNQIIGNYAERSYGGGYVEMDYNSSTTFFDNVFRNNTADLRSFGGLYLYAYGNSQINGGNLQLVNNTANIGGNYYYGGGYIYAEYNSTINLPNTRVIGNQVGGYYGGAYFEAYDHSTVRVPDLYVYDNVAGNYYGGVYLDADDGNDTVIATNARVISNTAGTSSGGAYVNVQDGSLVDLTGALFQENTATSGYGGGLYVGDIYNNSQLLLGNTQFLTNTAGSYGGGIYFSYGPNYNSYLDLSYARFISNTAGSYGGGFYMEYAYYNAPTEVSVQADHLEFIRNTTGSDGGGFYLNYAYEGTGQMIFDDGIYRDNTAGSDGGAVYWEYCYEGCFLSMSRNHFENNEATSYDGGAIYFYEAYYGSEVHFDDNTFLNNTAGGDGGAFYNDYFAEEGAVGTFDRNVLRGNKAGGDGGGFYSDDFGYDGAIVSFSDNLVEENYAEGEGGGVYMYYPAYDGVELDFNRNTIQNNISEENGGGLYMDEIEYGSRVNFNDNIISGNVISSTGTYDGGGIYLYLIDEGSIVWMRGNQINDNVATGDGGGLYIDDYIDYGSVWYFEDNELQRNWAGDDGGGCYFDDYWYDGSVVHFNRNLINDNTAIGDYGACHFYDIEYADVDIIGNQFNRNTAGGDYGALFFDSVYDGAVMRFWNNQIIGNQAGISGTQVLGGDYGGIYFEDIESGGEVNFYNNEVLSNTAYLTGTTGGNYGGMYADLDGAGLLRMRENVIAGNIAEDSFGGFAAEMYEGARLVMGHNLIQANTAITETGGVYIYGEADSQYFLSRNQIVDNAAGSYGGLWLDNGDTIEPLWGLLENNLIANNQGGGVYLWDADFRSTNDTIADNGAYGVMITGTQTVSATAWLSNTIVWGHTASLVNADPNNFAFYATYSDIEGSWPGTGNINADPLFVGSGDYHLQAGSPAIDQVDASMAPHIDLDGVPRPVPLGGLVDMGAYEFHISGVELGPDLAVSGDPGTQVQLVHTITNTGNAEDEYMFMLTSALGWDMTVMPGTVVLMPGESTQVTVTVDIPDGLMAGVADTVDVAAYSTRNALVADGAQDTVTVALVPALTFEPDRSAGALAGNFVVYEHTLTNLSNGYETFQLSANSSEGWTVSVVPSGLGLAQGESAEILVYVFIPSNASNVSDTTVVTAVSYTDSAVSAAVTDQTTAYPWPYTLYVPLLMR